jgi:hypothetical protein
VERKVALVRGRQRAFASSGYEAISILIRWTGFCI